LSDDGFDDDDMIEIRPDVGMYAAFARLRYEPWYALAELVDNALQSYQINREALMEAHHGAFRLSVSINVFDDLIEIRDTAAGIARSDFPRAFRPARRPPDTDGLSEFGLGMKAAASWLAKHWSVRTSALGEPAESTIAFDIPKITTEHLHRLPAIVKDAEASAHYTILTLQSLNVKIKPAMLAKIKRHLASIYRMFLREGSLELRLQGEPLTHAPVACLIAPRFDEPGGPALEWRKEFSLTLDATHRISGWAGLLKKGSVDNAGFAVFRRRRLIEGSDGEAYRPKAVFRTSNSYTYQRLVGELNVEGFGVSHTKDGIQWDDFEEEILAWLRGELDREPLPLLQQAEGYRARPRRPRASLASAASDTQTVLAQRVPPLVESQLQRDPDSTPLPTALTSKPPEAGCETQLSLSHLGQSWSVSVELINDETTYDWLEIAKEERTPAEHLLHIRVNVAHPFLVRFAAPGGVELNAFVRLGAGLAIAEVTARATGVRQAGTIRRNLNQLLRDALAEPFSSGAEGEDDNDA
jgi:hypothetical protein